MSVLEWCVVRCVGVWVWRCEDLGKWMCECGSEIGNKVPCFFRNKKSKNLKCPIFGLKIEKTHTTKQSHEKSKQKTGHNKLPLLLSFTLSLLPSSSVPQHKKAVLSQLYHGWHISQTFEERIQRHSQEPSRLHQRYLKCNELLKF